MKKINLIVVHTNPKQMAMGKNQEYSGNQNCNIDFSLCFTFGFLSPSVVSKKVRFVFLHADSEIPLFFNV